MRKINAVAKKEIYNVPPACFVEGRGVYGLGPACGAGLVLEGLHFDEAAVVAFCVGCEELFVGSGFNDATFVHDADEVGFADCGEAMSNHEGGSVGHEAVKGLLHQGFAFAVESGCGFVED